MEPTVLGLLTVGMAVVAGERKAWARFIVIGSLLAVVTNFGWVARRGLHFDPWPGHELFILEHPSLVVIGNLLALGLLAVGLVRVLTRTDTTSGLARSLARRGDHAGAAEIYLRAGLATRALRHYRKGRAWPKAAEVALDLGRDLEAADALRRAGGAHLTEAARIYRRLGDTDSARRCHAELAEWSSRENRLVEAIAEWLKAGEPVRAARAASLALSEGQLSPAHPAFPSARHAAEEARDYALLGRLNELDGAWSAAARCWHRVGNPKRAAECHHRADELSQAAAAWSAAGNSRAAALVRLQQLRRLGERWARDQLKPEQVKELEALAGSLLPQLEALGLHAERVEALTLSGRVAEAVDLLVQGGDELEAAQLAVHHQRWDLAGPLLERAGRWGEASDVYEQGGRLEAAARCAERAGEDERAVELFRSSGHIPEMARCMARTGRLQDAVTELHRAELLGDAWELIRSQPGPVPDIPDVLLDLAGWLRQERSLEEAISCLQRTVVGVALGPGRLDTAVALARLLVEAGEPRAALTQLDRVLEFDFAFAPAQRLRQELLAEQTTPTVAGEGRPSSLAEERYEILTELGRGGMGVVYRAHDHRLDRDVAVKILRTTSREEIARLEAEARAAATLSHPGIVTVYDFEAGFGGHFIAMELVDGEPLDKVIRTDPERVRADLLSILLRVTEAVAYAHSKGVIHRDLKPGNILLTERGKVKIYDFGIAARLGRGDSSSSGACGTPFYMAPEQIRGHAPDPSSDVYSLGATFFHLATGRPPFARGNVIAAHLDMAPPNPIEIVPELPPRLGEIILRCLAKEASARFANAGELAVALRDVKIGTGTP